MSNFVSDVVVQFFKWEYFRKLLTRGPSYALSSLRILRAQYQAKCEEAKSRKRAKSVQEEFSVMVKRMVGRVFDLSKKELVMLDGFSMYVMSDDYIGRSIRDARSYEAHVTAVIRRELKDGGVFLDLGANIGYHSMLASTIVKSSGKVIAFEPNPQNLQLIYASMLENKMVNMTVYPYAVSDAAGILRFTTVGSNGGVVTEQSQEQEHFLLVPAVVLDEVLKYEPRIDLIKMDIEAHEPAALRGMEKLLSRHRPKIITEYHPWAIEKNSAVPPQDYLEQLIALGYRSSVIDQTGNCLPMPNAGEITRYWAALGVETINLDLLAEPI